MFNSIMREEILLAKKLLDYVTPSKEPKIKRAPTFFESVLALIILVALIGIGYIGFGWPVNPMLMLASLIFVFMGFRCGWTWDALQNAIVEERYIENDYRNDQVYVGQTLAPGRELIHFVGAKPEDVAGFMQAWFDMAHRLLESNGNPVIMASIISFAFVFIHPFNDGNGRIHRYLLHHVLTAKKFNPDNIIFPVSAVLYKQPGLYDEMLESFSRKLMEKVDYVLADDGSMTVTNETGDFYRFINFTKIVEDFFDVVEETLKTELIPELDYLIAWERARIKMRDVVDMPEKKALQFIMFTQQNNGKFPKSRRKNFEELSETEIEKLAAIVEQEIISRNSKN